MDKISVIVPVYNSENYLSRCIDSILGQTYAALEVILINDGSTDNSGKICEEYAAKDSRIRVLHKENGGQSSARNMGLEVATGKYVGFVDSDDWIVKNMYEYLSSLITKTRSDVANLDYRTVTYETDIEQPKETVSIYANKEILREYLLEGTYRGSYSFCRNLYKRELFEGIRFPVGKINEDIVTNYLVLERAKKMIKSNYIGYFYFQDSNSTTRGGLKKRDFDLLDVSEELVQITQKEDYEDISYLAKVKLARGYFSLLAKICFYGISDNDLIMQQSKVIKSLTSKLRGYYFLLMGSPLPLNRKIMITAVCININGLILPIKIYKKIKGVRVK